MEKPASFFEGHWRIGVPLASFRQVLRAAAVAAACAASCCVAHTQATMPEQVLGGDTHSVPSQALPPATAQAESVAAESSVVPEYALHPGDVLSVSYRFTPEYDDTATVGPDGRITLKNIGSLAVGGATLPEVKARVLQAAYTQLRDPEITVALDRFQPQRFVVAGEVRTPGSFDLRQPTTVLQAILLAGGPGKHGHMGHVLLFRHRASASPETHVLDLKHLQRKHLPDDILLQPNDMVLVQR